MTKAILEHKEYMTGVKHQSILIVDDSKLIIKTLVSVFEGEYRIKIALDGYEALRIAASDDQPDIILLDITMPGMDGGEVFDHIRALYPSMSVILASGHGREGVINDIMERGCRAFIQKPYLFSELSRKVQEILGIKK